MSGARAGSRDDGLGDPGADYERLAALLRDGLRLPLALMDAVLAAAGRSYRDLAADVLAGPRLPGIQPGDRCEVCRGPMHVYASRKAGGSQVQYVACSECGYKPADNRRVVPAGSIRRRRRKKRSS
jgi:hypothetical protein